MKLRLIISIIFCVFILPSCNNSKILQGVVIEGKQEARQINISTANISIIVYNIQEGVYI